MGQGARKRRCAQPGSGVVVGAGVVVGGGGVVGPGVVVGPVVDCSMHSTVSSSQAGSTEQCDVGTQHARWS